MAEVMRYLMVFVPLAFIARGQAGVVLHELSDPEVASKVRIELKAEGKYLVATAPGTKPANEKNEAKSLLLKVESRYTFVERVLEVKEGKPTRVGRRVIQAASVVQGEVRPFETSIRPEMRTLVVEPVGTFHESISTAGPLTRPELELVQGPGDPLAFGGLFSSKEINVGDTWTVGDDLARALTGYDTLTANQLEASLKSLDDAQAELTLKGHVRGSVLGGEGSMGLIGSATFDRKLSVVTKLRVDRAEVRQAGPVETGLDMQSSLSIERLPASIPPELTDAAISGLPKVSEPGRDLLTFTSPDGTYTLLHDRAWHIASDDIRQVVFKRLDRGELIAQCNLVAGPNIGKGQHQDVSQFRDDVKKALGVRFVAVLGAGEVDGNPAGNYRYKVAIQGREGDVGVLWYYYLVASPSGDQLLVTFTLGQAKSPAFGEADLKLISSLEWTGKPRR